MSQLNHIRFGLHVVDVLFPCKFLTVFDVFYLVSIIYCTLT